VSGFGTERRPRDARRGDRDRLRLRGDPEPRVPIAASSPPTSRRRAGH